MRQEASDIIRALVTNPGGCYVVSDVSPEEGRMLVDVVQDGLRTFVGIPVCVGALHVTWESWGFVWGITEKECRDRLDLWEDLLRGDARD